MSQPTNRLDFLVTATAAVVVATGSLVACGGSSVGASEFKYGIASGDPLTDRVVLWTHAKVPNILGRVTVPAKMPWITVWDDHEFANITYVTGAENHNTATQGDWTTRKSITARAPRVDADPHARRQQPAEDLPPL